MAILGKVREYRWELWLFFGMGVVGSIVGSLVQIAVGFFIYGNYGWSNLPFFIASFAVLAISYRWVRRLQRPMLKLVWQYSLVAAALGIGFSLVQAGIYDYVTRGSYGWYVLFLALAGLVQSAIKAVIFVWLARRASRGGFDKALVLIGIAAFPGASIAGVIQYSLLLSIVDRISPLVVSLATIVLTLVAVWALKRVDTEKAIGRKGIAVLFGVAWAASIAGYAANIDFHWAWWTGGAVVVSIVESAFYAIVIWIAYSVRVRAPAPAQLEPVEG